MNAMLSRGGTWFTLAILVFAVAFVGCMVARLVSPGSPSVLLIWPGAGVALAFGWRRGVGWVLPAAGGSATWVWLELAEPMAALTVFAASATGPAVAALAIRKLAEWKPAEYRLDAAIRFALMVILVAAPIDSLIAAAGLPASIGGGESNPVQRFFAWWLIDSLGMMLIAPALLVWSTGISESDQGGSLIPGAPRAAPGMTEIVGREARHRAAILDAPALLATIAVIATSAVLASMGHPEYAQALLFL
jgi:integral membrane sensor domain MASE1